MDLLEQLNTIKTEKAKPAPRVPDAGGNLDEKAFVYGKNWQTSPAITRAIELSKELVKRPKMRPEQMREASPDGVTPKQVLSLIDETDGKTSVLGIWASRKVYGTNAFVPVVEKLLEELG